MTQPIRLVLPDVFQDGLAKLTEHAVHVDVVSGAVAQQASGSLPSRSGFNSNPDELDGLPGCVPNRGAGRTQLYGFGVALKPHSLP